MKGEIRGICWENEQPLHVKWQKGIITEVDFPSNSDAFDYWIAPALIDLQINGFAGIDFQQGHLSSNDLLTAARGLYKAGCARFLATLVTNRWEMLLERLRHLRRIRSEHPLLLSSIVGWHIEGPFLSGETGYAGAHAIDCMEDPTPKHIRELRQATGTDPVLLTLAPERPGAIEAIRLAKSLGITVSLGHTNANAEQIRDSVSAGAKGFTHLANACPQLLDRHDNIVWRVLDNGNLTVSLIPDQIHVSPALFRIVHQVLPSTSICYTTDAISAAGQGPGRYRVGRLEVDVGVDGIARQPGKTNYAGSTVSPIEAIRRASSMLGQSWREVWKYLSVNPARFMDLPSAIQVGQPATFCRIKRSRTQRLDEVSLTIAGEEQ